MSTAPKYPTAPSDPIEYGWRYVSVTRPDGKEALETIPLSLEDVLHPHDGDFIVQTDAHNGDRDYLYEVFKARLKDEKTAAVLADCGVDLNIPGVRPVCPDIAVFSHVKRRFDWLVFNVAAEGARPRLVVEITSRSTRKNDLDVKLEYYERAKVPCYLIADAVGRGEARRVELICYRNSRRGFRRVAPDENGRVHLDFVNLDIGVTRDRRTGYQRLACYDPETGEELGDYVAVEEAAAAALKRSQKAEGETRTAKRQAAAAKRQAAAAKSETAAAKSETAAAKRQAAAAKAEAEAAERRALAEAERAQAVEQARAAAEARVRALEAQLGKRKRQT